LQSKHLSANLSTEIRKEKEIQISTFNFRGELLKQAKMTKSVLFPSLHLKKDQKGRFLEMNEGLPFAADFPKILAPLFGG
jgi:hypothetical protein